MLSMHSNVNLQLMYQILVGYVLALRFSVEFAAKMCVHQLKDLKLLSKSNSYGELMPEHATTANPLRAKIIH